jgi:uncharacterized membrane protein
VTVSTIRPISRSAARNHDVLWRSIVWAGTALYAAIHTGLIVSRYQRFGVYTFDFGIFDQGLWLLSRFEDPFVTLRGLNLFADHSSYIMVLLIPLYWVWADPRLLLSLTVIAISASAALLYGIARRIGVAPGLAGVVSLAFLVHPAVRWVTWDNFHPEVLALPLLLGATVCVLDQRLWWAVLLAGMALMTKEDAALLVVPFGLWVAFIHRERATGLTIAGLGVAVFTLNFQVLLPFFSPTDAVLYSGRYAEYGTGAFGVIVGALTSPAAVLDDLFRLDTVTYLRDMVLIAPTSLAAPFVLAMGVPITLTNLLSSHIYQSDIRYHYTVYLLTAVGLAAVFGARWLQARATPVAHRAIVALVVIAALAGLAPGPGKGAWGGREDATRLEAALELIGPDDVVSANSTVAVHLAHRRTIYRFPNPFQELDYGTQGIPYDPAADEVQWVVLDPARIDNFAYAAETLEALRRSGEWMAMADDDGVVLLRRR